MMQRPRFPRDVEGEDVWGQLADRWQQWQRSSAKAPLIVVGAIVLIVLLLWLATGVYMVGPGEQGVDRLASSVVMEVSSSLS